ncbi:MAG: MFS transporter [Burkholderiales bacterium]
MTNDDVQRLDPLAQKLPTIIALNAVSGIAQLSQMGIVYPLVALWLADRQVSASEIGLVGSLLWTGMLLGILFAPHLMYASKARTIVIFGCIGSGLAALAMPWIPPDMILAWCSASVIFGFGIGLRWIGNESWLYSIISGAQRGKVVGIHETLIHLGQVIGPLLIAGIGIASANIFYLGAMVAMAAVMPLLWANIPMQTSPQHKPVPAHHFLLEMVKDMKHIFGIRIGYIAGVVDGVLFGMLAVYEVNNGATTERAALVMTVFGIGGLLASAPLGWMSDKHGVIIASATGALTGIVASVMLWSGAAWLHWPAVFLLGAVAGCLLTIAIIAGTEQAAKEQKNMGSAMSEISISFTIGTIIGPVMAGAVMDAWGLWTFPALTLLLCFAVLLMLRMQARVRS